MLETAEMLKMLNMLNVFWTIGPPQKKQKNKKLLTFQLFRAYFRKKMLETAEMLKMLKEKCSKLLKC